MARKPRRVEPDAPGKAAEELEVEAPTPPPPPPPAEPAELAPPHQGEDSPLKLNPASPDFRADAAPTPAPAMSRLKWRETAPTAPPPGPVTPTRWALPANPAATNAPSANEDEEREKSRTKATLETLDWEKRRKPTREIGWWGDEYVIYPTNSMIVVWDVLTLVLLLAQMWTVPFEVGAYGGRVWEISGLWGLVTHLYLTIYFIIDTFLYFFRAVRDNNGRLVWRLEEIAYRYATGWFAFDLLSCIPAYSIAYAVSPPRGSPVYHALELMQLLRLLRLTRINRRLMASPTLTQMWLRVSHRAVQLLSIAITSVYVAHCMACLWCFTYQLEDGETWVTKYLKAYDTQLDPLNNGMDLYVLGLYWSTTTMVSVGYGDVVPLTRAEYWVCAVAVMISAWMWAWVVAALVDVVGDMALDSNALRGRLAILNRVATPKQFLSRADRSAWHVLLDEARVYLHTENQRNHDEERLKEVLGELSQGLHSRILLAQAQTHVLRIPYLARARINTVLFLAGCVARRDFNVDETVVHDPTLASLERGGVAAERCLYFVMSGTMISVEAPRRKKSRHRNAGEIASEMLRGVLVHDTDDVSSQPPGRESDWIWRHSTIRVVAKGAVWDADNFVLANASPLYRPMRLKALTYCETLVLPRSKFVEAIKNDPDLFEAVKWHRVKVALKVWARRVLAKRRRREALAQALEEQTRLQTEMAEGRRTWRDVPSFAGAGAGVGAGAAEETEPLRGVEGVDVDVAVGPDPNRSRSVPAADGPEARAGDVAVATPTKPPPPSS